MAEARWTAESSRRIVRRVVVEGDLILQTAAHLGNGDGDAMIDMPLLRDPLSGGPLLPGASLAGALRAYLLSVEFGECNGDGRQKRNSASARLFGGTRQGEDDAQSALIVEDALGQAPAVEVRDGVRLNGRTRTAEDRGLFSVETWPAGSRFPLRFELVVTASDDEPALRRALATALEGLHDGLGAITLGARKYRGYGRALVDSWRVTMYDMGVVEGLLGWITADDAELAHEHPVPSRSGSDIIALLGGETLTDARQDLTIEAAFALQGSLLIRSGQGQSSEAPDVVHLHARQSDEQLRPIVSSTSLTGAMRARALRIARTIAPEGDNAQELIEAIFGPTLQPERNSREHAGRSPAATGTDARSAERASMWSSRVRIQEQPLTGVPRTDLVQSRVSIDRFTGGTYERALFDEQPAFATDDTGVALRLRLINPKPHEVGLLLLVVKDLWTSDLPLGGEAAVGRGRLRGREARITQRVGGGTEESWTLRAIGHERLMIEGDREALERWVADLASYLAGRNVQ